MNSAGNLGKAVGAKLETAAFYALLIIIALSAIPNGTVDDRVITLFVFLVCVCAVLRVGGSVLNGNFRVAEPAMLSPLICILLLALVQYIVSNDFVNAPAFLKNAGSVAPYETRKFLLTFTALLICFEILFRFAAARSRLLVLVSLVIFIGAASAALALIRQALPIDKHILWESVFGQSATYAQFVNRNHFALLMEMSLGLLIGLIVKAGLSQGLKLFFLILAFLILIAAILANSRGAIISLLGLGIFIIFGHFATRKTNFSRLDFGNGERRRQMAAADRFRPILLAAVFSIIFIGGGIFTIAFVGGDPIAERIETIQGEVLDESDKGIRRSRIWQSTLRLIREKPLTGVGFGGYGGAITLFDDASGERALEQAHNDYLEVLANGGIIAFVPLLLFFGFVIYRTREQIVCRDRFRRASCFGAAAGIFAVLLHSIVDFGLQTIINALIFLILLVIATARIQTDEKV